MRKIRALYKVQYRFSDLVSSIRETRNKRKVKYQYYAFRNQDGSICHFPVSQVTFISYPKTNEGIFDVTLYDYDDNKAYVTVMYPGDNVEKLSVPEFYKTYGKHIYLNKEEMH